MATYDWTLISEQNTMSSKQITLSHISQHARAIVTPSRLAQAKSKAANPDPAKLPGAPPPYNPQPVPKVLQTKTAVWLHEGNSSLPGVRGSQIGGASSRKSVKGAGALQLARKKQVPVFWIGEEGRITVKGKKYRGYLFMNNKPTHFDFSHDDKPWPITLDFKGCESLEYESDAGKKRTLIPYPDEGINAKYTFLNRNRGDFFRLVFGAIE